MREQVLGEVAELERILVSNSYGTTGRELVVEATMKGLDSSDGLDLQFWADTPSGEHEELVEIKANGVTKARSVRVELQVNR
jgi:hypothetical protein